MAQSAPQMNGMTLMVVLIQQKSQGYFEDFSNLEGLAANDRRVQLRRIAAGMVDELESPQHLHQQIHFRF